MASQHGLLPDPCPLPFSVEWDPTLHDLTPAASYTLLLLPSSLIDWLPGSCAPTCVIGFNPPHTQCSLVMPQDETARKGENLNGWFAGVHVNPNF